ncbi:Oidioi.mRNA.OKI2018_I69.chr1.g2062.t1.cds [Oikopleura dioica]|uniref:Oidioi.mRNA.OKI2018_I69.chr1.g2062.t1.cds n=1 Tax=Oikopleura dioica TaxID=34765 RepID=A0ABN7SZ10_OIKDI|nr:Oidioi.mRNA.OKI2018_I69.chr1.g2062.t1.cds [Oikopleura dioica]
MRKKLLLETVKEDFSPFFPAEPDSKYFNAKALRLFKTGGSQSFPKKPQRKVRTPSEKEATTDSSGNVNQKMKLSRDEAEDKLVELGAVTREDIDYLKRNHYYGQKGCKVTSRFKKEVEKDFSAFFPAEPDKKSFKERARLLFKKGGSQYFTIKSDKKKSEDNRAVEYRLQPEEISVTRESLRPRKKKRKRKLQ